MTTYNTPENTTLSRQNELKRYPVPKLEDTMSKFLQTAKPFLTAQELEMTKSKITDLMKSGGTGQKLQELLEEKANNSDNWVIN